ncbi:HD domain-containing protein [Paenibacillus sp. YYML68]|uniref:HD domain-containing protein n=1 Tax=Paenibacillus sp. YYML68 TaxID=2909250 RepID=UPI002491DF77|nr:HD domain-containing protein [Paenibacillus sp. YYML68]
MNQAETIALAQRYAREALGQDSSGHDWHHSARVARTAVQLAQLEQADSYIAELAAWLHDVADEKLNESKEAGLAKVERWLRDVSGAAVEDSAHVLRIIANMSYNGGHSQPLDTMEGKVVQDADRLDALGAVGIARTFAYSGWKGQLIYDPELCPREQMSAAEYRQQRSTAINHFYEKLLKLRDLLHTESARRLAEERHQFMLTYLEQFARETGAELPDVLR